ncbi:MAG: hypothetical protein SF182_05610 [Deltaproteobacteria bacterium]|nr:hypothetical protein [Deltaproteobacteria bacterium]
MSDEQNVGAHSSLIARRSSLSLLASRIAAVALAALLSSAARASVPCPECNGDGMVAINELVTGIAIALGERSLDDCPAMDADGDGALRIAEIITALNVALGSACADAATPTPTATPAPIPTEAVALRDWLRAGTYLGWAAESQPHRSSGPHGGYVRTYLNDVLFDSLSAANPAHPAGAAAVKELYYATPDGPVREWAVMIKLDDDSDLGRNWYWYEGLGLAGTGLGICTGCHSAGRDFVLIPFPLQ